MLIYFIIALIGAVICGSAASARGRSAVGWFIYGLLLWPIALIHVLVLPRNAASIEKQQVESGEMVKCPMCAELIKPDAKICKHCRSPVDTTAAVVQRSKGRKTLSYRKHDDRYIVEHDGKTVGTWESIVPAAKAYDELEA